MGHVPEVGLQAERQLQQPGPFSLHGGQMSVFKHTFTRLIENFNIIDLYRLFVNLPLDKLNFQAHIYPTNRNISPNWSTDSPALRPGAPRWPCGRGGRPWLGSLPCPGQSWTGSPSSRARTWGPRSSAQPCEGPGPCPPSPWEKGWKYIDFDWFWLIFLN